jgi:RNA polymerase sigma-70 factor (ECF subfamily)
MSAGAISTIASVQQSPTSWVSNVIGPDRRPLTGQIFGVTFARHFKGRSSKAADSERTSEHQMVAKGTEPGDPRSKAAEFAECISKIATERSEPAFDVLFRYFAPRIKSYCLRLGADDSAAEEITQEAMVSLWRNAAQFDPSKAAPSTWIFTIARNLSIDRFRKSRRPEFDPNDPALTPDDQETPDRLVEQIEIEESVRNVMDSLSANERNVVMLSFYDDLSHSEISRQLRLPIGTVKSRIRLAFAKLRSALDAQNGAGK